MRFFVIFTALFLFAPIPTPGRETGGGTAEGDKKPLVSIKDPALKASENPASVKTGLPLSSETAGVGAAMNAAALLPIGVPSYDVRMPEFEEDRLVSRMKVRKLTRIDHDHLDMKEMDLECYLPTGGIDYVVLIERGFYEMRSGRLVSSSPTRLRGKSIDLHGEGCVYSRGSEVIKILGKVTSYIYVEDQKEDQPATPDRPPAEDSSAPASQTKPQRKIP